MVAKKRKGKKLSSGAQVGILVLIIAGVSVGVFFAGEYLGFWSVLPTAPIEEEFSVSVIDGMLGKTLPNSDFNFSLYGSDTLDDFIDYELIESGDSLSDVTTADLEEEIFSFYIISFVGDVEHEDSIYGDDDEDDISNRAYYERWAVLDPLGANVLVAYQTPSDADFVVVNAQTFAYIDIAGSDNITATTNFTIIAGTNSSEQQQDAIYMYGANYENEEDDYVIFRVQFNTTVSLSTLAVANSDRSRHNATTVNYMVSSLGATPQSFSAKWDSDAVDIDIIDIDLLFGDTVLSS